MYSPHTEHITLSPVPSAEHVAGVPGIFFSLCPAALPSVAPHFVQVRGSVQVAAVQLC